MQTSIIDKSKYTHTGSYWGVPIYLNIETLEIEGRNKFYDWLLEHWSLQIDQLVIGTCSFFNPFYEPEFKIKIKKEIEK